MKNRAILQQQFEGASLRWPNLESSLITWPEDKPCPDVQQGTAIAIGKGDKGELCYAVPASFGISMDTAKGRFRAGCAGMIDVRRDLGKLGSMEYSDLTQDDIEAGDRWKVLATHAGDSLEEGDASEESMLWQGFIRWVLVLHEKLGPAWGNLGDGYQTQKIDDLFLHSALAIEKLDYSAPKSPDHWQRVMGESWRTIKRKIDSGEIDSIKISSKRWRVHNRHRDYFWHEVDRSGQMIDPP